MSPRLSDKYQFIAVKSIYIAAATTYQAGLWSTDPANQASITAITYAGSTVTITTAKPHGLTSGLPTAITGIVSTGGAGATSLQTLLNSGTFGGSPGVIPLNPTVLNSTQFSVSLGTAPTDAYTSGGVVGAGGELAGGAGPYARQSIVFTGSDPTVSNNAQINWTGLPAVADPGAGIPTLYVVIYDNAPAFAGAGASNMVHVPILGGATIQAPVGQIIGAVS